MRQSLNPIALIRDGFDWTGRTGRLPFFLMLLVYVALSFCVIAGLREGWPRWQLSLSLLAFALVLFPFQGHVMRRLNDLGWTGWFWWVSLVPVINIGLFAVLTLRYGTRFQPAGGAVRFLAASATTLLALLLIARIFWTPVLVTTVAMKPTLRPGDYTLVRLGVTTPMRGEVMALHHPTTEQVVLGRIIGLPGEEVQVIRGVVHINGQPSPRVRDGEFTEVMERQGSASVLPRCANGAVAMGAICRKDIYVETVPIDISYRTLNIADQRVDHTEPVTVPEAAYFVLGDNRDHSADSRISTGARGLGMVPQSALIGRAERIVTWAQGAYLPDLWWSDNGRFWDQVE